MSMQTIQNLIERLSNLLRAEVRRNGDPEPLAPVQLEALHYLAMCNRYSDTPLAVADFLGLTKGTTSQTLRVLERRGLLSRKSDAKDGRVVHLKPTPKGYKRVELLLPSSLFHQAESHLSRRQIMELENGLTQLLLACQQANRMKSFGACHTCRFNQKTPNAYFCQLTQEPLSVQDVQKICREHEAPPES